MSGRIRNIQTGLTAKLSRFAYNSPVYNWLLQLSLDWSLGGHPTENLIVVPSDYWKGNAEKGRWILSGAFSIDETTDMDMPPLPKLHGSTKVHDIWEPYGVDDQWLGELHSFDWLRDLRELGGDEARKQARDMLENWIQNYRRWTPVIWRSDVIGMRISNWLSLYNFYGASAHEHFQDQLVRSITVQAKHLSRSIGNDCSGLASLQAIKGLIMAGICLSGRELWLEQGLDLLEKETGNQILSDGGHVSRSPAQMIKAIRIFLDIKAALAGGGYPIPAGIDGTISNLAQVIRFFRYPDRNLAVFHGTQEGSAVELDEIMKRIGAKGKVLKALPSTGFERVTVGRSLLMIDGAAPPKYPYDQDVHAAPLAFEFSYGKERIFVNCGTHPSESKWNEVLRGTAAHNTLSLDYRNACEISEDGHFARRPRKVSMHRDDQKDAVLVEGSHDGYMQVNGITHRRRFYLSDHGHDLRGEEMLHCSTGMAQPCDVALRFHLHPRVLVSLIQDGKEALLRLPSGSGWRFFHSGGHMLLENSIYLGQGARPRKTKQLVIYGRMEEDHATLKWALRREGR